MPNYLNGFLGTQQAGVEARNDVTVFIKNWWANRNPLVTRLPYVPVERVDFVSYNHPYRNISGTIGGAISSTGTTAFVVNDTSSIQAGDILQFIDSATGNSEYVWVNGDPSSSTGINVVRGTAGTSALSSITNGSPFYTIGNSRNGAAVNQTGLSTIGTASTNYCQTFQFGVQVGGSAQSTTAQVMPGGVQTPFSFNQTIQLQNMVDSIETTLYYGLGQAPNDSTGVTAKCAGLKSLLVTNNTTVPTNLSSYASSDLIRDTLQACRTGGGEPDILVVSTNWMSAFSIWGQAVQRLSAGETEFGTPIKIIKAPFLDDVTIIEAPLLRPFSAIALTSSEVYIRNKRNPFWQQRGIRGDMWEGDWISELGLQVVNESHHAWLEGVTAFSAN